MYKLALIATCFIVISAEVEKSCGDNPQCIENELIKFVDHMERDGKSSGDGYFEISRTSETFESPRNEEGIFERCLRYLVNHEIRLKIPSADARSILEESRSSKLKKIILPILLLLKLKAAIVIPIILSIIALVSFKGLGASLIALAISGATGLKGLLENHAGNSKFSYEIIPPYPAPHWNRAGVDPMSQGYHTIS